MSRNLFWALMCLSQLCHAEELINPTDTDLKVAYCIKINQHTLSLVEPFKGMEGMKQAYLERETEIEKMQAYLFSKTNLNYYPLMVAAKSALADIEVNSGVLKQCGTTLKNGDFELFDKTLAACAKERNLDAGFDARQIRIRGCTDKNLLPY